MIFRIESKELPEKLPLIREPQDRYNINYAANQDMDYARGINELAKAIIKGREGIMSSEFSLHVNEVVLAMHNVEKYGCSYKMTTKYDPGKYMFNK